MKFSFAAILCFAGSALAITVGFLVKQDGSFDGQMVSLPIKSNRNRLYVANDYDSSMFLKPTYVEASETTTLSTFEKPARFVNVDSDGFLILSDQAYSFNDTFDTPNLQNIFVDDIDTFYLVANDIGSYDIKALDVAPEGSIAINLGQTGVDVMVKRNKVFTFLTSSIV